MEIFGVPILYTPYLSHPDPTVKRRMGFLTPVFGGNSDLGATIRVPYFVTLGDDKDFTFDPMFTTRESVLVAGEYRQRFNRGELRARLGGTKEDDAPGDSEFRGHVDAEFNFDVNEYWRWGGQIQVATDDTFLDRYDISAEDTLISRLFAEGFTSRNYAVAEAIGFQGLNDEDVQDRTPIIAPNIDIALVGEPLYFGDIPGGRYGADFNVRALTREEGVNSQRLSGRLAWRMPVDGLIGDKMSLEASIRGDLFRVENSTTTKGGTPPRGFDGMSGRVYPEFKADWRWPLVRPVGRYIQQFVEPVGQIVIAPNSSVPEGVPNEDSILFEFDETSLFSGNRFPGLDRVEGGSHVAYGLNFGVQGMSGGVATAFFGQSYQLRENTTTLVGTGIADHFSDYVLRVEADPIRYLNFLYKARLDKDTLRHRRSEIGGMVGVPELNLNVNYVFFDALGEFPDREEIFAQLSTEFSQHWRASFDLRRDLTRNGDTLSYGGTLGYHCDCLDLILSYRRDFTRDRDVEPEDTVMIRATFKHLGQLQSQVF